jgi:BASS family bile acid:Na+ symporter
MFSTGLALGGGEREERPERRRRRRLVLRALVLNLVVLPLVALGATRLVGSAGDVTVAVLLLAACPGGRFAPHLARLTGGDVALSVEIALFLAKLVAFTAPLTSAWLLGLERVELRELPMILQLLALQMIPYLAGKQLRRRRPRLARRLVRPTQRTAVACLAAMLAVAVAHHGIAALVALGERGWAAAMGFALIGSALGWLTGGPSRAARRSFMISVNARDLALALMIANLAYADRVVPVATFTVGVAVAGFGWLIARLGWRRSTVMRPAPS